MKSTKFDRRPNYEERLTVAIPADLKAKVFAMATRRGLPAGTADQIDVVGTAMLPNLAY